MRATPLLLLVVLGVVLRLAAAAWERPHGDVLLDTAVARELLEGHGFRSGFDRGTAFARGDAPVPPQDRADQHAPLWPVLGAGFGAVAGDAFGGLRIASLLAGLLVLVLTWRVTDRLVEGVPGHVTGLPALATALVAVSFLMIEFSADGALYMAQALLVLLLAERLAAPRPSPLAIGLVLGVAWLLNHQAAVLLPVPALVLFAGQPAGARGRGVAQGLLAVVVACLVVAPWWWRNSLVFGDPFHTTNAFYPLHAAGVGPELSIEEGVPVARMPDASLPRVLLSSARAFVPPNVLYLVVAGMLLWPGLAALVAAGLPALLRGAWGRDRRVLALLASAAALLSVSLLWPDLKLRYLVPITPVVIVLGVRLLAAAPARFERAGAWLVAVAWGLLVAGTASDFGGERHARWILLAAGGPVLLLLPLLLRHVRRGVVGPGLRVGLTSGLIAAPLLALAALLPPPHSCYHGNALLPDIFGQPKDLLEAREHEVVDRARRVALADGARVVCGPESLMAFAEPELITLPFGGRDFPDVPLAALVDAGRCDHVITLARTGWLEGQAKGETWLDGRLVVVEHVTLEEGGEITASATVSRVAR